jgi:hypothetical protein
VLDGAKQGAVLVDALQHLKGGGWGGGEFLLDWRQEWRGGALHQRECGSA